MKTKYTVKTSFPYPQENHSREDIVEAESEEEAINAIIADLRISFVRDDGIYFFRLYARDAIILYNTQIKSYELLLRACGLRYTVMEYYPYDVIAVNKYWERSGADAERRYLTEDRKKEQYDKIEVLWSEERKGKRAYRNVIVSGEETIIVEGKCLYSSMTEAEEALGRDDDLRVSPVYASGYGELYFSVEIGIYPRSNESSDRVAKEVLRVHKRSFLEALGITFAAEAEKKKRYRVAYHFCGQELVAPVDIIEAYSEEDAIARFKIKNEWDGLSVSLVVSGYYTNLELNNHQREAIYLVATELKD